MYAVEQASAVIERALGLGIDYLDTAIDYGDGESERRVGRVMATRRRDVFLATKVPTRSRTRDAALREVEGSLKRLQTDHVDLLHIHSLGAEDDLAKVEAQGGALEALRAARAEGGALRRHDQPHGRRRDGEGHRQERPRLRAAGDEPGTRAPLRGAGPARGQRQEPGRDPDEGRPPRTCCSAPAAPSRALLRYGWSLPVSAVVCGMPKLGASRGECGVGPGFAPMPPAEVDDCGSSSRDTRSCWSASSRSTRTAAWPSGSQHGEAGPRGIPRRRIQGRRRGPRRCGPRRCQGSPLERRARRRLGRGWHRCGQFTATTRRAPVTGHGRVGARGLRSSARRVVGSSGVAPMRPTHGHDAAGHRSRATAMWAASVPGVSARAPARRRLERGWHRCGQPTAAARRATRHPAPRGREGAATGPFAGGPRACGRRTGCPGRR